jgi:hypothetical protein
MWEKLIDASVPKLLTERVLIALLFIALSADDYLLATHHGNIGWFSQAAASLNTKDIVYFIMVLALSWLFVLPFIKTVITLLFIPLVGSRLADIPHWVTNKQLLVKAIDEDNSVAYQHWENHIKHIKTRQVVNELYFYVLAATVINLVYENSFMRHLLSEHLIITLGILGVILYLGLAVGIVDNIQNNDGLTDVPVKKPAKDASIIPRL